MSQIADAPYIVEAERYGMPPYDEDDFDYSKIESYFTEAKRHINKAVNQLCYAADEAEKYGKAKQIDELIQKLEDDFEYEMDQVLKKLKGE